MARGGQLGSQHNKLVAKVTDGLHPENGQICSCSNTGSATGMLGPFKGLDRASLLFRHFGALAEHNYFTKQQPGGWEPPQAV